MTSENFRDYNTIYINIKIRKCEDEESSFIRKDKANRWRCETGASRDIMKITSEQSGQKAGFVRPVALNDIPPLRENVLFHIEKFYAETYGVTGGET